MTDADILKLWRPYGGQGADALLRFSRLLIHSERVACVDACKSVQCRNITNATRAYIDGKEMARHQCMNAILARNDLPTGE